MERAAKERLIGAVVLVTAAWLLIPVFLDQRPARDADVVSRDLALPERAAAADGAPAMRRETIDLRPEARAQTPPPDDGAQIATLPAPSAPADRPAGTSDALQQPLSDDGASARNADDARAQSKQAPARPTPQPVPPASTQTVADEPPVADTNRPAGDAPDIGADAPAAAGRQLWAVQLGSFSDKANAQRLAAKYRGEGLPAFISEVNQGGRTLHRVRIGPQASRPDAESVLKRVVAEGQAASVVAHP